MKSSGLVCNRILQFSDFFKVFPSQVAGFFGLWRSQDDFCALPVGEIDEVSITWLETVPLNAHMESALSAEYSVMTGDLYNAIRLLCHGIEP